MTEPSIDRLRSFGSSRVALVTTDGTFVGRFVAGIGDHAIMILFVADGSDPADPLVIAVEAIRDVSAVP